MYLLDANAFMEASRLYYAFDLAPGFWAWLGDVSLTGKVGSIDSVREEITTGSGDLVAWARKRPAAFWLSDSDDVLEAMRELAQWAVDRTRPYRQAAIDEFLGSADFKLIAHAMAIDATVVTREQSAPEAKKRVKIPDACIALGVKWTDPYNAYRALGLRLTA